MLLSGSGSRVSATQHRSPSVRSSSSSRAAAVLVRAVAEPAVKKPPSPASPAAQPAAAAAAAPSSSPAAAGKPAAAAAGKAAAAEPTHFINVIPHSAWPNGVPPVMGAHLMASGIVAPISTSKGAGDGVEPHQFQYPGEGGAQVVIYATPKNAAKGLAKQIAASAAAAIKARGAFTLVLSGGSALTTLGALADVDIDWSKVWVFFADERNVPHSSADSNYAGAVEALLGRVSVPPQQVFAIKEGLTVQQAATEYAGRLLGLSADVLPRNADGLPVFDVVALGVGPDGHIASLFPNRPELADNAGNGAWVLPVTDSPKPPPERITLTLPVINAAAEVLIIALGESKAEVVQRVLEVQALPGALPAQLVRPKEGRARFVLDALAAQELNVGEWDSSKDFPRNK